MSQRMLKGVIQEDHQAALSFLLSTYGVDPNFRMITGRGPIYSAAQGGHIEVVKLLVEHRAHLTGPLSSLPITAAVWSDLGNPSVSH